jgi:conjugal transfer mating pair stabilization protein TraG
MNAYEVFAYWNGIDIFNALNAVAAVMGGGDYLGLMKAVGMVGLLAAVSFALLSQRGASAASYFMGFVFIYGVMFVPKVNVIVNDLRAGTTYVVANVPVGLAAPYATISRIGNFLTQQYEARFTALDDERFSKTGMVFGARVLETMALQGFPDPTLKSDIMTFYKDCIVPELIEDGTNAKKLKNSKEISQAMELMVNAGRGTVMGAVQFAGSNAMSCANVIPAISSYLTTNNVTQESLEKVGRVLHADKGVSVTSAVLIASTESDVTNMLTNLMSISDSAQQALAQSMWINGIHDADMALRNGYGNSQTTSYAAAVTERSSRQAAYTGKMWAEKALPLIRNIAEFVLIAAFPLVFIIMLVAGENALKVIKLYLTVLTSLALWAPFTAILNSLVINNGKQAILAMKANGGGITLENVNGLIDLALQQQSLAGQLFLAVPMVAYALVSAGAQAATSAIGGLTSSATGAAGQVSGQAAVGNVGGGQVGWRNVNAFNTTTGQSNTAMSNKSGFAQFETGAGTMVMGGGAPGGGTFNGRTSQLGSYAASVESAVESGFSKRIDASMSASRSSISSALDSIRAAQASGFRSENATRAEKSLTSALATSDAKERSRLMSEGASYASAAATEAAASQQNQRSTSTSAGGSLSIGIPGVGAGLNAGGQLSYADSKTESSGSRNTVTGQIGQTASNSTGDKSTVSQSTNMSSGTSNSSSQSNFAQTQLDKAVQFSQQGQAQAQQAQQASEQLSGARTDRGGVKTDLSNQIVAALGGAAAAQQLYASDQQAFGAAVNSAAEAIISAKSLGPGASSHFSEISNTSPVTSSNLSSAQQEIQAKVASEISGTPEVANAIPTSSGASSGQIDSGSSPLSGPAGNPFKSSPPTMPSSVANASGQGAVSGADIAASANQVSGDIANTVSNGQAAVMRNVGRTTDEAVKGR